MKRKIQTARKPQDWLGGLPMRVCPECGGGGHVADPAAIGGRMREMREAARLTGREVARRLGLSAMYVCDLEHGRRAWNAERVTNYVAALRPPSVPDQATARSSPRVVPVSDLRPCANHITCLPGGKALIDATADELRIIELYAREIDRIKPPLVAWVTEANASSPDTGEKKL